MGYWGYGYGNNMGMEVIGGVLMIVFWALVIALVVMFIRRVAFGRGGWHCRHMHCMSGDEKSPIDILKERYAKGEIKKEDFEQMKKDLQD